MHAVTAAVTRMQKSDESLAGAAKRGDADAFAELAARYRPAALAYARARLSNPDEAEDVCQEALVRAYSALARFRVEASWGAWLMRIVRNLCHDSLRRRRVRNCEPLPLTLADERATPEAQALAAARRQALGRAVAALPEKYRTPLLMRYSSRLSYREIALAVGVPESTVVGRLAGALRLLRRRMAQE